MALKCKLLHVMLADLIRLTTQSIAGVTYMDHFDFEQRYRNVYECDPFHWYPLHLPPHCAKMYEKLIRKGITTLTNTPVRIMQENENINYELKPSLVYSSYPFYETEHTQEDYEISPLPPYMKMFQMLRDDVQREPSAPVLTNLPGFGVVALYKQPISKKSGQYIKKISGIYRDANTNYQYNPYIDSEIEQDTTTSTSIINTDIGKDDKKKRINQQDVESEFDISKTIKNGNLLAMLRTMHN